MTLSKSRRLHFCIKPILAIKLVVLADVLFYGQVMGSTLGGFALALIAAVIVAHPAVRSDIRARWTLLWATVCALGLINAPSFLGWTLFWSALAITVLSPHAGEAEHAWRWFWRLGYAAGVGLIGPALDVFSLLGPRRRKRGSIIKLLPLLALPVVGGGVFLGLFAMANPVIGQILSAITLPALDLPRALFWIAALIGVWTFLRPRYLRWSQKREAAPLVSPIPGVSVGSVGLSLLVFNGLFALQNGLDLAFLWSGAALPKGVTLADYAHRGAYPLIATALLAGLFVLVALRPGSATARQPGLKGLVVLWVAQNVLLVSSSILRVLNYIEAYSLTRLRIAALVWMGLVAVGLVLICWRLLRDKSSRWLINANALAAILTLTGCGFVDLGGVAAAWNVEHAREAGGDGPPLDLCYLSSLHDAALTPLSALQTRPLTPAFRDRVSWVRAHMLEELSQRQSQWRGWTWRGQDRLAQALALVPWPIANRPSPPRACDGSLEDATPVQPVASVPAAQPPR